MESVSIFALPRHVGEPIHPIKCEPGVSASDSSLLNLFFNVFMFRCLNILAGRIYGGMTLFRLTSSDGDFLTVYRFTAEAWTCFLAPAVLTLATLDHINTLESELGFLTRKVALLNRRISVSDRGGPVCQHFLPPLRVRGRTFNLENERPVHVEEGEKCSSRIQNLSTQTKLVILILRKRRSRITAWINGKGALASVCKAGVNLNPSTFPL